MAIAIDDFLTACLLALGDSSGATWSRTDRILVWACEAVRFFPILRPMLDDHTAGVADEYYFDMPAGFREVISVEYPISQQPPVYLVHKNHLDPHFYDDTGYFDVDHDYTTGEGWTMYVSGGVTKLSHIKTQYLADHDAALEDASDHFLTVPDEYENLLILAVMTRAYRERLSFAMQDPTAHSSVIMQLTDMVSKMEQEYRDQVTAAQAKLAHSVITPRMQSDKYDRVY
jgi:hypothetical protein